MKLRMSNQNGAALIVALVAMIILTVLGVATMTDVMNQSSVVRNEQFRQRVFYAASSELNVQIDIVNSNFQQEEDKIIEDLINSSADDQDLTLEITAGGDPAILTSPEDIVLEEMQITGSRMDFFGCPGESIGKVKVLAGNINATARLDDGQGSIQSVQTQRYIYCWP